MKKLMILGSVAAMVALTSCDDFLNDNRYPLSQQTANAEFWSSATNVEGQINNMYNNYTGYGNSTGYGAYGMSFLSDDQCGRTAYANWTYTSAPASDATNWGNVYGQIRLANVIIEGVQSGALNGTPQGNDFIAKARLHRARQYYFLVQKYGDVPLVDYVLDTDSPELYGPRVDRNEVMDFVLEDLNFAVSNISTSSGKTVFSSDLANAIKTEICLFEGTFSKYIEGNSSRAQAYLQEAVTAGEAIAAKYPVQTANGADSYWATYNTLNNGLSSNPEIIFCKTYSQGVFMHSTIDYTNATDGIGGMSKDAFDSYLFLDGKPLALTSYDTTDAGVLSLQQDDEGKYVSYSVDISNLLAVRDQRLSVTTYDNIFFSGMSGNGPNFNGAASSTAYGTKKYNNFAIATGDAQVANRNYTSCPLYWGAKLCVEIAEAKAELGTLTDQDIATYIAPLWQRAGIEVTPTLAMLSTMNDPANNMGVSSLIWEIRRQRRNELMLDGNRYWDLIRWKQLDKLDMAQNPNTILGANISMWLGQPSITPNGALDPNNPNEYRNENGYILSWTGMRTLGAPASGSPWNLPKEYFYPIPNDQIGLNKNLTQNPGW